MATNEESTEHPAGIDVAFDWVKNVLTDQLRTAELLDIKTSVLFTLATAILGAGAAVRTPFNDAPQSSRIS